MPQQLIGPSTKFKPKKFSEDEQRLRDLWNAPEFGDVYETEGGYVQAPKPPSIFRGDSPVVGTEVARAAESLYKIAPNLRGKTPRIQLGPGKAAIDRIMHEQTKPNKYEYLQPEEFGESNLLGVTSYPDKEVNLNPNLGRGQYSKFPVDEVLGHELTHASGYLREDEPEEAEGLIRRIRKAGVKR